jgi:hypothetical protein
MTRTVGQVAGSDYKNKGEFTLSFWASLYADDAATPLASREPWAVMQENRKQPTITRWTNNSKGTAEPKISRAD